MKAIQTKLLPTTRTLPARVKAFDSDGNEVVLSFDDGGNDNAGIGPYARAAIALCQKMKWTNHGKLIAGWTNTGYVFVFADSESFEIGE